MIYIEFFEFLVKMRQKTVKDLNYFRVINIFQKERNLTYFVIYLNKINILPSTWVH